MEILLEKHNLSSKNEYNKFFKENSERWLKVDEKFLFDNQFNTVNGFRILSSDIKAIKNDVRQRKEKDDYFLKYSEKLPIKEFSTQLENKSFYSCNGKFYRISGQKTLEFMLDENDVPYIMGTGFLHFSKCRLNDNQLRILKKAIKYIKSL